tara:strand:+ start:138 stop:794 length:657 start_codon:yes stop_codon:yes gene_type:complete
MIYLLDVVTRWGHVLFGIAWVGLLYYFNFVQTEYMKEASDAAKTDVTKKLAPRALWWFRWAAVFTFLTGVLLLGHIHNMRLTLAISIGALIGTIMFLNVWLIIWPNQKIVIGLASGDKAKAAPRAGLASRTNTLLSLPMLYFMIASAHASPLANGGIWGATENLSVSTAALVLTLIIIGVIEINAIWGKMIGLIQSVRAVITSSVILTAVMAGAIYYA